jgi:hypothetical protein
MRRTFIFCSLLLAFLLHGNPGHIFAHTQPFLFLENYEFDLDGDGKLDRIYLCFYQTDGYGYDRFIIEIPSIEIIVQKACNLDGKFEIVDIDSADRFMEIVVPQSGPSDDHCAHVFRFDGREIFSLGNIPGACWGDQVRFDGSGIVTGNCRSEMLYTWSYCGQFRLNEHQMFELIEKDFYEMKHPLTLTLKVKLPLKTSPSDTTTVGFLHPGDRVIMVGTDNKSWCLMEAESGLRGWLAVEGFNKINGKTVLDVFDGLKFAD